MTRELTLGQAEALAAVDPDATLLELDRLDSEESLRDYIKLAWPIIEPGRTYVPNWHIDCISDHLMAVSAGQIKRIMFNIPPGGMKSLLTDAFWPSHEWGPQKRPELRYVSASYNIDLTVRDNRRTRNLIQSPWYQALWGDRFQLVGDQNAKTRFDNDHMGFKIATSVGGLGTGERGDRFICFPGEEMAMTDRGPMEIGDVVRRRLPVKVWSMDVSSGECGWHGVTGWHENPGSEIVEVVLSDGARVRCTPDHRLWTRRGWVRADELRSDDALPLAAPPDRADVGDGDSVTVGQHPKSLSRSSDGSDVVVRQSGMWVIDPSEVTSREDPISLGVGDVLRSSAVEQVGQAVVLGVIVPMANLATFWTGADKRQHDASSYLQGIGLPIPPCVKVWPLSRRRGLNKSSRQRHPLSDLIDAPRSTTLPLSGHLRVLRQSFRGSKSPRGSTRHSVKASHSSEAGYLVPGKVGDRTPLLVRRVGWADRTFCLSVGRVGTFVAGHSSCISQSGIIVTNCDDPHNIKDGESTAKRNEVLLWFSEVVPTRLTDPQLSAIIVIMQRVHEQDVAGLILEKELGYVSVCLPMEFEPDRKCFVEVTGFEDPRVDENQLLWPERMTREVVERDKKAMGSYAVAAQFQQRPAPRGGGMFRRIWWQFYDTGHRTRPQDVTENPAKPKPAGFDMLLVSVDAAFKSTASGSRVGIVVVGTVGPYRYVVDNRTRAMTFSETVAEILLLLKDYPRCNRVLIEDKANGPAIIDTLSQKVAGVIPVNPEGGKEARAHAMQSAVESGHWVLPEGAPWVDDFITEFATFPASSKNDQVDATTQAAIYLTHGAAITRVLGLGKR